MRVAIVDEELPYPPDSGKRIRTFQLVRRLALRHRLTYLCHRNADPAEARRAEAAFGSLGIETVVVDRRPPPRSGPGFYARLAANLASPLPYSVASHASPEIRRAVERLAQEGRIDLWQAEWTPYHAALQGLPPEAPRLIMAHNVESQIWRRYHEAEANLARRWYIGRQWRKFERFESRAFAEADGVVAVSEEDAEAIRGRFGGRRVVVVENGVDTDQFRPGSGPRDPDLVLFLGSLDWRPNLDAVDRLLACVFPAVLKHRPSARLAIVGRNPPEALRRRTALLPNVELHASVADVRPFLHRSALMVVPLRIGGGSRLKILEAFAAGLPVVSTRVGAEGLMVEDGRHLAVVEGVEQMADQVVLGLRDPGAMAARAALGRSLVEARYDWDGLAERLEWAWADVLEPGRPAARPFADSEPEARVRS
ncbi:glycosyltransferase [Paludisphaera soli]|uniref:glycosyltransferase n=1 Tax=Paludisphaera soli TaxID=2712865 RepID=UPI0013ED6345|nr:glycosyltransferase [Paludisphaera soli]